MAAKNFEEPHYIHSRNGSAIYKNLHTGEIVFSKKEDETTNQISQDEYKYIGAINKLKLILCDSPITDSVLELIKTRNIKNIQFDGSFNYSIDNLPDSVEYIYISYCYYKELITKLPRNLKLFKLGSYEYPHKITCWPDSIRKIYLYGKCDTVLQHLPPYLEVLDLFDLDLSTELWYLPISLKELYLKAQPTRASMAIDMVKYQRPPYLKKLFISAFNVDWIFDTELEEIAKKVKIYIGEYGYINKKKPNYKYLRFTEYDDRKITKEQKLWLDTYTTKIARYNEEDMFIEI